MPLFLHSLLQQADLYSYDLRDTLAVQRFEGHDIIDTVDKLRGELLLQRLKQGCVHTLTIHLRCVKTDTRAELQYLSRTYVTRQHDDRVAEINAVSLTVGQTTFVQDLQQDVEDIRMGLLDLVKEDDRVGPAAYGFGQLAAVLVRYVARRRAY